MIAMKFTIELDIGLSFLLQAALPQLVTDRETKTHRRGRSKRSYGHCRRRTEIPEAEPAIGTPDALRGNRCRAAQGVPQDPFGRVCPSWGVKRHTITLASVWDQASAPSRARPPALDAEQEPMPPLWPLPQCARSDSPMPPSALARRSVGGSEKRIGPPIGSTCDARIDPSAGLPSVERVDGVPEYSGQSRNPREGRGEPRGHLPLPAGYSDR